MDVNDLMKLFSNAAQSMSSNMEGLENERIEAQSGAGMVKLKLDGTGKALEMEVDPLLFREENKTHLEQLILAAINDGRDKCAALVQEHAKNTVMPDLPNILNMRPK